LLAKKSEGKASRDQTVALTIRWLNKECKDRPKMENPSQRYDPSSSSLHKRIQDGDCSGRGGKEKGKKIQERDPSYS